MVFIGTSIEYQWIFSTIYTNDCINESLSVNQFSDSLIRCCCCCWIFFFVFPISWSAVRFIMCNFKVCFFLFIHYFIIFIFCHNMPCSGYFNYRIDITSSNLYIKFVSIEFVIDYFSWVAIIVSWIFLS